MKELRPFKKNGKIKFLHLFKINLLAIEFMNVYIRRMQFKNGTKIQIFYV